MSSRIEYIGFRCPRCGDKRPNPEANHKRGPDGVTVVFKQIVNAYADKMCDRCVEKSRGSSRTVARGKP